MACRARLSTRAQLQAKSQQTPFTFLSRTSASDADIRTGLRECNADLRVFIDLLHSTRHASFVEATFNYVLPKVDISDPYTFLEIKRGILQYTWVKPILAIATVICKATGTFREGVIALNSGYFWTALIYNVSICWSLYDLALFWVCMSADLQPFRPMPKFLCIKGIIFASWWQGFLLSIFVWLGAIPSLGGGYTPDNLATAIQDALICFEMPIFAVAHWYAFSWRDYSDRTISDARIQKKEVTAFYSPSMRKQRDKNFKSPGCNGKHTGNSLNRH